MTGIDTRINQLDTTFNRLQARKTTVRKMNNMEHVQLTVRARETALVDKLEQMLAAEKKPFLESEDET